MISKRRYCRGRKCTTKLHGGVCHRTSTQHKSGNKMKGKKKTHLVKDHVYEVNRFQDERRNKVSNEDVLLTLGRQ